MKHVKNIGPNGKSNSMFLLLSFAALSIILAGCAEPQGVGIPQEQKYAQRHANLFELIEQGFDYKPTFPHLPNHIYKEIDNGKFVFLHFDNEVGKATQLLYTGIAIPGNFCRESQEKMPKVDGKIAFTHFHKKYVDSDNPEAGHGGIGGEEGYWFQHVAVAEFDMPWGKVVPGIDFDFMPTSPPVCEGRD